MQINKTLLLIFLLLVFTKNQAQDTSVNELAQQKKLLTLKEAVQMAVTNSDAASLAKAKVETSKLELDVIKNNRYPSVKASGQYLRLSSAHVDSNIQTNTSGSGSSAPLKIDQLMLGQVNATMPVFNGFKLKNSINESKSMYKAETFSEKHSKEQIGLEVVELFANLYKAQQMVNLIQDNLKSADQRVKDFTAMEENGLIARNDLLKAQLQQSNVQLSLDNAKKNTAIANYKLITLLKLPENTQVDIDIEAVKRDMASNQGNTEQGERNDLKSLELKKQAAESGIKIAKANYYPSLNLTGGYIAFDLNNVLTVTNAMNFGVGVSYDLSSIFKNSKNVKLAQSKTKETEIALSLMTDQIKEEVFQATENYNLSLKQSLVYEKAVTQATENYRIVKDKYDNSLVDTNDLLEADFQQLQSKINQALSKADVAQKYYELQFASGKLNSSLNISQK
ncbi:TolC family protein [Flavobacterium paronense]|uniref:TolC family protein n=1 Tax=Flavobacterium paronense TaxID=1392775 RepID=A0ABV5GA71_9FLAO|nr:TolC family protein [Flavobacterium paronense]MDN3677350.1 TolC family protein [Flavobacterium paronense]